MNVEKEIPNLCYFFGGFINQDFNYEFGSIEGAVDAFFNEMPVHEALSFASEIEHLLAQELNDEEFDKVIIKAGCEYYTYADNLSGKAWLQQILKRAHEHANS
jgi:hypothetical protein